MQPLIDNAFATRMKATYVTGGDGDHLTVVPGPASDVGGQLIEWVTHLVEVRFGGGDDEHIDVAGTRWLACSLRRSRSVLRIDAPARITGTSR
jgi:hypothetical protein